MNEEKKAINRAVSSLMNSDDGKQFLKALLETTGIFKATVSGDKEIVMFYEGKRSLGISLISLINEEDKNNLSKLLFTPEE